MKRITLAAATVLALPLALTAQQKVSVNLKDGTSEKYDAANFKEILVLPADGTNADRFTVSLLNQLSGAPAAHDFKDIASITTETTPTTLGAQDFTTGFFTVFSNYYTLPSNKTLELKLTNHTNKAKVWNNWLLLLTNNKAREADGYTEYLALRADQYGWATRYDAKCLLADYTADDSFMDYVDGADVTVTVHRTANGFCAVKAVHVTADQSKTMTESITLPVEATEELGAFLSLEQSYFSLNSVVMTDLALEDAQPTSIELVGAKSTLTQGTSDFLSDATAYVSFANGYKVKVPIADLTVAGGIDYSTTGEKTASVSYGKTLLGNAATTPATVSHTINVVTYPDGPLTITKTSVGAEDNSTAYWGDFSQFFTIPKGRTVEIVFKVTSKMENVWNGWVLAVRKTEDTNRAATDAEFEYFVLRIDPYGWGTKYDAANLTADFSVNESDFIANMNNATVTMRIEYSLDGKCKVTASTVAQNGKTYTETLTSDIGVRDDIVAFLSVDNGHLDISGATLGTLQ